MQLLAPAAVVRCGWLEVEEMLVGTMAHLWMNFSVLTLLGQYPAAVTDSALRTTGFYRSWLRRVLLCTGRGLWQLEDTERAVVPLG